MMGIVSSCLALFETEAKRLAKEKQALDSLALLKEKAAAEYHQFLRGKNLITTTLTDIRRKHHGIPKSGPIAEEAKDLTRKLTGILEGIERTKSELAMYNKTHTNISRMDEAKKGQESMGKVADILIDLGYTDTKLQLTETRKNVEVFGRVNDNIREQVIQYGEDFGTIEHEEDDDQIEEKLDDIELEMELDEKKEALHARLNSAPPSHVIEEEEATQSEWERDLMR